MSHGISRAAFGLNIKRGNKVANDQYTGYDGELTLDLETGLVRLHDGVTLGGKPMVRYDALGGGTGGAGPTALIGGDATAGLYGEVPASEFITGGDLAMAIGLTAGTLHHDTIPWLKFALDGKTLYVPQKSIRYNLTWQDIYQAGAVYGVDGYGPYPSGTNADQNTTVTIGTSDYRVRLLRGVNADFVNSSFGYDISNTHGSEWNRLLYPAHSGNHSNTSNPATHTDPNAASFGSWAQYSDSELLVDDAPNLGIFSFTQETTSDVNSRVLRGGNGITYLNRTTTTHLSTQRGWRPVLELVQ